jgi:hypothetical protein
MSASGARRLPSKLKALTCTTVEQILHVINPEETPPTTDCLHGIRMTATRRRTPLTAHAGQDVPVLMAKLEKVISSSSSPITLSNLVDFFDLDSIPNRWEITEVQSGLVAWVVCSSRAVGAGRQPAGALLRRLPPERSGMLNPPPLRYIACKTTRLTKLGTDRRQRGGPHAARQWQR